MRQADQQTMLNVVTNRAAAFAQPDQSGDVRRVEEDGEEFLVVPGVSIKEGVYPYPRPGGGIERQYLPGEEIDASRTDWEDNSVVLLHPKTTDGTPTVTTNEDVDESTITEIGDLRLLDDDGDDVDEDGNTMLRTEAWLDLSQQGEHSGDFEAAVEELEAGEVLENSTGYLEETEHSAGVYNGQHYDSIQRDLSPDHLAIFPPSSEKTGNCSVDAGCTFGRVNVAPEDIGVDPDDYDGVDFAGVLDPVERVDLDDQEAASVGRQLVDLFSRFASGGRFGTDAGGSATTNGGPANDDPADTGAGESSPDLEEDDDEDDDPQMDYDNEKQKKLVEEYGFDLENLPAPEEDCFDRIYDHAVAANGDSDGDGGSGDGGSNGDTDTQTSGGDGSTLSPELEQRFEALEEQNDALREKNDELEQEIKADQRETQDEAAEAVANESPFDVDADAIEVDPDAAEAIVNQRQTQQPPQQQRGQYGAGAAGGVGAAGAGAGAQQGTGAGAGANWAGAGGDDGVTNSNESDDEDADLAPAPGRGVSEGDD